MAMDDRSMNPPKSPSVFPEIGRREIDWFWVLRLSFRNGLPSLAILMVIDQMIRVRYSPTMKPQAFSYRGSGWV